MSTITINGKTFSGNYIVVTNGKVFVNGEDVTPDSKEINISVEGNIDELKVDACKKVSVNGNVGKVKTTSGDVDITGDVNGGIQTVSGDVDCGNVAGSISTVSGDVKHKRS
jgi:hypothetical protein